MNVCQIIYSIAAMHWVTIKRFYCIIEEDFVSQITACCQSEVM